MATVTTAIPAPRSRAALSAEVTVALATFCGCGKVACADELAARVLLARLRRDRLYPIEAVRFYRCPQGGAWHWTRKGTDRRDDPMAAGPVGPSCTDGEHHLCIGTAWDVLAGRCAPCSCCARHPEGRSRPLRALPAAYLPA